MSSCTLLRTPLTATCVIAANADVAVNGELTWQLTDPSLTGRLELRDSLRSLGVTLHVDEPAVDARGTVRVLGEMQPRFDLEGTLAEWNSERVRVAGLSAQLVGTLERFDVRAAAAISVPDLPQAQVALDAAGSLDALDVARLSLTSEHGGAVAHGHIARVPEWSADLTADVDNFDPALLAATLSGAVSGRVELAVQRRRPRPHRGIAGRSSERRAVRSEGTRRRGVTIGGRRGKWRCGQVPTRQRWRSTGRTIR